MRGTADAIAPTGHRIATNAKIPDTAAITLGIGEPSCSWIAQIQ